MEPTVNIVDEPSIIEEETKESQTPWYPSRIRCPTTRFQDVQDDEPQMAMLTSETVIYNTADEHMHSSLDPFRKNIVPEYHEALSALQQEGKEPVDVYLPEPRGLKLMLCLPPKQRDGWLKAYRSELKNLIINNQTFMIKKPRCGEMVIPTKPVFKAKQTKDGYLDKLKVREVARGDLEECNDNEDIWSPGTSTCGVCMHLVQAAKAGRTPKQADFIGAYLQVHIRGHYFVRISRELAKYFPEYTKWLGVPLRLKKDM